MKRVTAKVGGGVLSGSLQRKISVSLLSILLAITPAFYFLEINTVGKAVERSASRILHSAGETLGASLRSLIEHKNKAELTQVISVLVRESPWLQGVVITDENLAILAGHDDRERIIAGSRLTHVERENASRKALSEHSPVFFEHSERETPLLSIAVPVFSAVGPGTGKASGTILISYDLNKIRNSAMHAVLTETAIDIIIFAAVLLLLNWLLRHFVVRPVRIVTQGVARLESGDLEARVPKGDTTEIGMLANSFNSMAANIKEIRTGLWRKGEELRGLNENLESHSLELERTNHDLQLVAYMGSHDLKEPLRMVTLYLKLIQKQYGKLGQKDFDELLQFPLDGAKRMAQLIDDLMRYLKTGSEKLEKERTDLSGIVEGLKRDMRMALEESGGKIIASGLPEVYTSPTLLRQLLQNLISNAIKFHGNKAPLISVSAEKGAGEWILSVSDNGIGFDPAQASTIFDPFRRLHSRSEAPGSGLGLAICKRIADILGGRIWTTSRVGEGSTFFFSIPESGSTQSEELVPISRADGDGLTRSAG